MVTRSGIVALRVSAEERQLIEQYAQREDRSISAAMRRIILKTVKNESAHDRQDRGALAVSTGL